MGSPRRSFAARALAYRKPPGKLEVVAPLTSSRRFTDPLVFQDLSDPLPSMGRRWTAPDISVPAALHVMEQERAVLQTLLDSDATSCGDAFSMKTLYRIWRLVDPCMEGHVVFAHFVNAVLTDGDARAFVSLLLGADMPESSGAKEELLQWKTHFTQLTKLAQKLRPEAEDASTVAMSTSGTESESGLDVSDDDVEPVPLVSRRRRKRFVGFDDFLRVAQHQQLLVMPCTTVGRAAMTLEALQEQRRSISAAMPLPFAVQ